MAGRLQIELKKKRPFDEIEEELFLNVMRSAEYLSRPFLCFFKKHGITGTQYNVLRILRGHGEAGLPCHEIGEQMVSFDPDLTRLLDRLEAAALVTRERSAQDRRVIKATITSAGLKLLASLDEPIAEIHRRQLRHLTKTQQRQLIDLLELIRTETP